MGRSETVGGGLGNRLQPNRRKQPEKLELLSLLGRTYCPHLAHAIYNANFSPALLIDVSMLSSF